VTCCLKARILERISLNTFPPQRSDRRTTTEQLPFLYNGNTSPTIGECNCYTTDLLEAFSSQRKHSNQLLMCNPDKGCSRYGRRVGYNKEEDIQFSVWSRVEAWSNTSTVTPRVVGGDEKGSLESERVNYGHESHGSRTRKCLLWQGPGEIVNDRPVLSSERAHLINKPATV
jgi:hypothetical protein